jgi:Flp pilus assembly protein TadG
VRLIRRFSPSIAAASAEADPAGVAAPRRIGDGARGQSLVEFSLVFIPLMLIFMGLAQFGFIFNGYITMTNAVRESARIGSIYLYNRSLSKDQNDTARNNAMRTYLLSSFNQLKTTAPNFTSSGTWTKSSLTWTTGDLQVTYVIPAGISDVDTRVGQQITVRATYHLTLIIPLVSGILPKDSGGRLPITTESTMVIN